MKLAIATIASLFASAAAVEISSVPADSKLGMNLLSKARRAEQNADGEAEADMTWISGYALKFQGCHHISQWNAEADGDEDVRIETTRLARFRLCPIESCSSSSGSGCSGSYGDYIVDMDTFLQTYVETKQEELEEKCEAKQYYCGCDGADDEQACLQTCFTNAGADYYDCIEEEEQNAYGYNNLNANGDVKLNYMNYMECAQYQGANGNNNGDDGAEYYVGPYCSDQGGKIVLGLFTDDTCTEFADEYGGRVTFQSIAGGNLPYSSTSIVDTSCYSCEDGDAEANGNNAYGYGYQAEPKESCTMMYENAGKCESKLTNELGYSNINENACTYMEGIKITRSNGIIIAGAATGNKVASAFIGIFTTSSVLLGAYVYYLKQKLERGSVNLSD